MENLILKLSLRKKRILVKWLLNYVQSYVLMV
jgi:hypothetical protein